MDNLESFLLETENCKSIFEKEIRKNNIPVAKVFLKDNKIVPASFEKDDSLEISAKNDDQVKKAFPKSISLHNSEMIKGISSSDKLDIKNKRIAVLFSGGPAAGGHNVIAGIYRAIAPNNILLGIKNGPKGLLEGTLFEVTEQDIQKIINTGGFDFLGSDRTKIKTEEQFLQVKQVCKEHNLDAIIIIGGDDSNTNAALLAEYLVADDVKVIGVPKTIDGDLQVGGLIPISFGFDTATKIYSELVGNILQDTPSSRKYWHFIKLMGRSASHVALEVALQIKPAVTLISEEVETKNISLDQVISNIVEVILKRAVNDINHGVVLIPEGLVEFIPEIKILISELNEVVAKFSVDIKDLDFSRKRDFVYKKLTANSAKLMASLPDDFENMLLLDRDSHGNLQVSQIPTEKLLIEMVSEKISEVKRHPEELDKYGFSAEEKKKVQEYKFATNNHFFGYEGRCGAPSLFDAAYTFNLGLVAGSLVLAGKTGYIAGLSNLDAGALPVAIPFTNLINVERRHGVDEFVIKKALVELSSSAFKFFNSRRSQWAKSDLFSSSGPRQLWGPVSKQIPMTVALNQKYKSLEFNY